MKSTLAIMAIALAGLLPLVAHAAPMIQVGDATVTYTPAQMPFVMDGSFATLNNGNGTTTYFESGPGSESSGNLRFVGTASNPLQTQLANFTWTNVTQNSGGSGAWLYNIYDVSGGTLLGFVHRENYATGNDFYEGLAKSTDDGATWTYLGNVLAPQGNGSTQNVQYSNCGGVPMLTVGNYFYIYYNERVGPNAGDAEYPAVARASISAVLAAFANNTVPTFYKYNDGTWTQPALTGLGSPILPDSVSTNAAWAGFGWPGVPVNTTGAFDVHSDAAYCSALGEYILTVDTCAKGELLLYTSTDGVTWGNKTVVDYAAGCWQPYSTIVGFDSSASVTSGTVGSSFYLYFTQKSSSNYDVDTLVRRQIVIGNGLTWDIGQGTGGGNFTGGSGTWSNGGNNWNTGAGSAAWNNGTPTAATFAGTAGTITIAGPVTASGLTFSSAGYLLTGNTLTLGGNSVIANADATIACPLAGSAGMTKTGSGTLTLSASNVFTGPVIVSAGVLSIGADAALGAVPGIAEVDQLTLDGGTVETTASIGLNANRGVTLTPNGGVFCVSGSGQTATVNGIVAGSGNLIKSGAGNLVLAAANTYTGGTTIGAGTLTVGSGGTSGSLGAGAAIISSSGTLAFDRTDNYGGAWTNNISGSGSVTVLAGSLVFSGSNGYTGATTISGGSLYLNGANATGAIAVAGGATLGGSGSAPSAVVGVANSGTLDFSQNSGVTFGMAGLTFSNAASIKIANLASYANVPAIDVAGSNDLTASGGSGSVTFFLSGLAPTGSGSLELLQYAGSIQGAGSSAFALNATGVTGLGSRASRFQLTNLNGFIDLTYYVDYPVWTGAVNGTANGTWNGANQNWKLALAGSATSFLSDDLVVFDDGVGTGSTNVSISGGNVTPGSVTFGNTAASYTLSGAYGITGGATLTAKGAGSVTIANSNGYSGGTTVYSGTLNATGANSLGSGPLVVNGGLVNLANAQSITTTNLNAGVLNLANASAPGSGPLNLNGGTLNLSSSSATLGSGPLNLNGGTLDNTSGSPMTLGGNTPENWNAGFAFLGSSPLNLGAGTVTINGSSTVLVPSGSLTVSGPIGDGGSGPGSLIKSGPGTLNLSAVETLSGSVTVNNGLLQLNGGGNPPNNGFYQSSLITVNSGGEILLSQWNALQGYKAGTGTLAINAGGLVTTSNGVTAWVTGPLVLNGGTLGSGTPSSQYGSWAFNGDVTANGAVTSTISATELDLTGGNAANRTFTVSSSGGILIVSGAIGWSGAGIYNSGNVVKAGPGLMALTTVNSYTGSTTITGGALQAVNGVGLPSVSSLVFAGSLAETGYGPVLQSSGTFSRSVGTSAGEVQWSGDGGFAANNGTLMVALTPSTLVWNSNSLGNGTSGFVPDESALTFGSPTANNRVNFTNSIDLNGELRQIDVAAGAGGDSVLISGNLTDSQSNALGGLLKTGAGTLILSGTNTYDGSTTVAGGELVIASAAALPAGANLTVGAGGMFGSVDSALGGSGAAVPEPGMMALLAAALGTVAVCRRFRRTRSGSCF